MVVPSKRVQADPDRKYTISEANGPWMIVAATFSGDEAEQQAMELVLELRRRYKLEAYQHAMSFEPDDKTVRRRVDREGKPVKMRYNREGAHREVAVLVGNYPSVEDTEAQQVLRRIKTLRPATLSPEERGRTSQNLAALRMIQVALLPEGHEDRQKGPMAKAFVTRNPLLPKDGASDPDMDPLVLQMNEDVKHSLLDCKGKYTVKVATFTGMVIIDQRKVAEYENGRQMPSRLEQAGYRAHLLTEALRKKGHEAYEYHDRFASVVTIGSFDALSLPRADGKLQVHPEIDAIVKAFGAVPTGPAAAVNTAQYKPKSLEGIPFDLQPQIVLVPRRPSIPGRLHDRF
jgi:hypothetical protein